MNTRLITLAIAWFGFSTQALAAESSGMSHTGGVLKMVLGLAVVLAVMAFISWGVKRLMPGITGQNSAVRIVGAVNVGSRERVVVLEVAGRWVVVGVAPGQVNGIADMEAGSSQIAEQMTLNSSPPKNHQQSIHPLVQPLVKPFSELLKKSAAKFSDKP